MKQWLVLYRKEILEMQRNFKAFWVPLVFIILGVTQPLVTFYTPEIIKNAGNLPAGTIIQIPSPTAAEVLAKTISQFGTLGVLILVLASMATIAGERQSGVLSLIMIKPVSHLSFITSKWVGLLTLTWVSFLCGFAAAWYYTALLFGPIQTASALESFILYGFWLTFIMTVTLWMSASLKGNGAIAFLTLSIAAFLSILTGLFSKYTLWSPARLTEHVQSLLIQGTLSNSFLLCLLVTMTCILCLLLHANYIFKHQENI